MPGLKIGYLPQEPHLEPQQTVREAVEQGIGGVLAAKKRLDEVYAEYAEPDADFDALAAEQAELEAVIAAAGSENTDLQLELAADALRLPVRAEAAAPLCRPSWLARLLWRARVGRFLHWNGRLRFEPWAAMSPCGERSAEAWSARCRCGPCQR